MDFKAKFIGTSTSEFEKGKTYPIQITKGGDFILLKAYGGVLKGKIGVQVTYDSMFALMRNWDKLTHQNTEEKLQLFDRFKRERSSESLENLMMAGVKIARLENNRWVEVSDKVALPFKYVPLYNDNFEFTRIGIF